MTTHLFVVEVKGDLGLKRWYVALQVGGLKGTIEAKEIGEANYRDELDLCKDRVEAMEPKEIAVSERKSE